MEQEPLVEVQMYRVFINLPVILGFLMVFDKIRKLSPYQLIQLYKLCYEITCWLGNKETRKIVCNKLGGVYIKTGRYNDAMGWCKQFLHISKETGDLENTGGAYGNIGVVHQNLGQCKYAMECHKKALRICQATGDIAGQGRAYGNIGNIHQKLGQYKDALEFHKEQLRICQETGNIAGQGRAYGNIGNVYHHLCQYKAAMEYHKEDLRICQETGDIFGQGAAFGNIGGVHRNLGQYKDAMECHKEHLRICKEIGDIAGQGMAYGNIGVVHKDLGQYEDAIACHKELLRISQEIGFIAGQGTAYGNIGIAHKHLGQYNDAMKCHKEYLRICQEIGDITGQGKAYCNIGIIHQKLGQYQDARKHHEEQLRIYQKTRDIAGEAKAHHNIGLCQIRLNDKPAAESSLTQSLKCYEKLFISLQHNDNDKISIVDTYITTYKALAHVFIESGKMQDALFVLEGSRAKALSDKLMMKYNPTAQPIERAEVRNEKITSFVNSCSNSSFLFFSLMPYYDYRPGLYTFVMAHDMQLCFKEMSRDVIADLIPNQSSEDLDPMLWFHVLALIKHMDGFAKYRSISCEDRSVGPDVDDQRQLKEEVVNTSVNSASAMTLGQRIESTEHSEEDNTAYNEYDSDQAHVHTTHENLDNSNNSASFLIFSFSPHEQMHTFVIASEMQLCFKEMSREDIDVLIRNQSTEDLEAMLESHVFTLIQYMSDFAQTNPDISCEDRSLGPEDVDEQRQFDAVNASVNTEIVIASGQRAEPTEPSGGENTASNEYQSNPSHVHSTHESVQNVNTTHDNVQNLNTTQGNVHSLNTTQGNVHSLNTTHGNVQNLNTTQENVQNVSTTQENVQNLNTTQENVQNVNTTQENVQNLNTTQENVQSLFTSPSSANKSPQEQDDVNSTNPTVENHSNDDQNVAVLIDDMLANLYKTMIAPVEDELTQPDIAIIPEGPLFLVPFAALKNSEGRYLSDYKRIRVGPSLTTLKLLRECHDDSYCKHGALIVGGPARDIIIRDERKRIVDLPFAKEEAEKISEVLSETALTGKAATKDEVQRRMQEGVAIIHIATHCSTTGKILLVPGPRVDNRIPALEDCLLTMNDIYSSRINAGLVVLSCCHSGRGEIRAEGVVGLTRAFLAAGARSVLASLWAVDDRATIQFMEYFYGYLKSGHSASASLQQAMREMRQIKKWRHPYYWAAFFIVGHDITLTPQ